METVFVGKNLIFLPVTDSTNSYAIDLLKNVNPADGTVVRAVHQLNGKGQRGSSWKVEPASNLTVSIILKTGFLSSNEQFFLYMIAALAVHDTTAHLIGDSQIDIKIKWPNDILVQRLKIAGILIENKYSGDKLQASVIGIGLNVNQTDFVDISANSLRLVTGKNFDIADVLQLLCSMIEKYFLMLKAGKYKQLMSLYASRLYGLNEVLDFQLNNQIVPLTVLGLGKTGLLRLEKKDGTAIEVDLKEIKWLL